MLLRPGIRYWFLLGYNIFYMLNYSILPPIFCFWDLVICVMKRECKINKIYVIEAKYQFLVIPNLLTCHCFYIINYSVLQHVFITDLVSDYKTIIHV